MTAKTVHQRIAEAASILAEQDFTKSGIVGAGQNSYNFIPISQILTAVRRAQAKAGVFVVLGTPEYDHDQHEKRWTWTSKNRYGDETTWYAAVGHITATIYGADGDSIETVIPFEAKDNSDKLTNKIITNALRCLYRSLYAIDEGSADPEEENVPNETLTPQAEIDKRAQATRSAKKAQAKEDPFFSTSPTVKLESIAREIVQHSRSSEICDGILGRYSAQYGTMESWSRDALEACLAEMKKAVSA